MPPTRTLTTGEIASHCGVNFRTVIRWIERGCLNAYKLPGRGDNRVTVEEFVRFLVENQMPVPAEFQNQHKRVLIVEDESQTARTIRRALEKAGFEIQIAQDGFRAGALLGVFSPAVITLDLQMPGLSGMDIIGFVRSTPSLENTGILVVSSMQEQLLQTAIDAGADDVLSKPFRNEQLVEKVSALAQVDATVVETD
jgi:excisionase family DNA binding protein